MSEHTDKVAQAYRQILESESGQMLMAWIRSTADEIRRDASRSEPTYAYGELKFADGMEEVITHIKQMCSLPTIGKER